MRYSFLNISYKNAVLDYIKTNNKKIEEMLGGDISNLLKVAPPQLSKDNILDFITEELSYSNIRIVGYSKNIYRVPDVATKTDHTFIFDEG